MNILKEKNDIFLHRSVLVQEVIEQLNPQPNKIYLDVTFGSGGHTRAILEKEPNCRVIAFDWDLKSIETFAPTLEQEFPDRLRVIWGNFAHVYLLLKKEKISKVDGILADFGTSQMQIKERPGFSLYINTPLDMRMSPAYQKITATMVLSDSTEKELETIFKEYGQEKYARKIAKAIVDRRKKKPFKKTKDLAVFIEEIIGAKKIGKIHPATKIFQALRIYVNRELENIHSFLLASKKVLADQGRLVCISFHSLEDIIVKQFFQDEVRIGEFELLTKKAVMPTEQEVKLNPAARSAKLRAAKRTVNSKV